MACSLSRLPIIRQESCSSPETTSASSHSYTHKSANASLSLQSSRPCAVCLGSTRSWSPISRGFMNSFGSCTFRHRELVTDKFENCCRVTAWRCLWTRRSVSRKSIGSWSSLRTIPAPKANGKKLSRMRCDAPLRRIWSRTYHLAPSCQVASIQPW